MKKILMIVFALAVFSAEAQEYKVAKSTGRLELHMGRVTVEGYNGNEIIFSARDREKERDPRSEGLTPINSLGLTDNTGLGVNVSVQGDVVVVNNLKKNNSPDICIQVPKGIIVYFQHTGVQAGTARFQNMDNEIEVSAQYNSVELENVTGPLTVKTIYGHVEATIAASPKDPISIVSIYGYVDVTLPIATKANLRMDTSYGDLLVDPAFKIDIDKRTEARDSRVTGKINGGGITIDLSCNYGKVYLRKK